MSRQLALAILAGAFLTGGAQAQSRSQPGDAAAPIAPSTYDSAFKGYQSFRDQPLAPWREVNDTAQQVGGHVGVLRAEQRDAAKPAAAPTPPAKEGTPPGSHGGMHKK